MTRFAICNETWGDLPFAETCQRIAAAGYDGVEIAPFTLAREFGKTVDLLTPEERQTVRRAAEEAGLAVAGLHWLLVAPPDGLHLTSDDAATGKRTGAYLASLAGLCADLGGSILVLGSPKQRSLPAGIGQDAGHARLLETIRPCLEVSAARGVALCIEPLGPDETNFINTLAEARQVIEASGSPACRTIFDVKAAATEGQPLPDLIRANADIVAHVHANDVNRSAPGFGQTDFVPLLSALHDIGYSGWVSIEAFDYTPDPDTIARTGLATLRAAAGASGS